MSNHDHDYDDDVEEFSYHCFDDCEHYPKGCKECDHVMHEGFSEQPQKPQPEAEDKQ